MSTQQPTSYWDYIKVEELLALQGGLEGREGAVTSAELLFIVVHQVYELWFKVVLKELTAVRDLLKANPVPEQEIASAVEGLERIREVFRVAAEHFHVVETISTRDYLAFRDKLFPASGFQSAQLREIEILFGLEEGERLPFGEGEDTWRNALRGPGGEPSAALARVERRLADRPSLRELIEAWLARTPIQGSLSDQEHDGEVVAGFLAAYLAGHERGIREQLEGARARLGDGPAFRALEARYGRSLDEVRRFFEPEGPEATRRRRIRAAAVFIASYRELPLLAWPRRLIDAVLEAEQAFLIFRQRHARMVERVIGRRVGTGGSSGVDYLDATALRYRIFKDLWAVRTVLLGRDRLPPLQHEEFYGFRSA